MKRSILSIVASLILASACRPEATALATTAAAKKQFKSYWFAGKAEISSYKLEQARYGEVHRGDALMVFVTESFLKTKQVKLESANRRDALPVLKLNAVRKFPTGLYDYSMMSSVFTPVNVRKHPRSLKVSTTSQEWCGHTFTQLNLRGDDYQLRQFSYFESEGDREMEIATHYIEDDLWTRLRINPGLLPTGSFEIVPGTMFARLLHKDFKPRSASGRVEPNKSKEFRGKNLMVYTLSYSGLDRQLQIFYEAEFPHAIAGWKEHYTSGWGKSAKKLSSTARFSRRIMSAYWNKHKRIDQKLRRKLALSYF